MDSKQNNSKKQQHLEHDQLPPELQWDNMEAGIFSKMEALQSSPPDNKKRKRRLLLLCFLLLILGTLLPTLKIQHGSPAPENAPDLATSLPLPGEHNGVEKPGKVGNEEQMPAAKTGQAIAHKSKTLQAQSPQHKMQQSPAVVRQNGSIYHYANTVITQEKPSGDTPKPTLPEALQPTIEAAQESNLDLAILNADKTPTTSSTPGALSATVDPLFVSGVMKPVVSQTSKQETARPLAVLSKGISVPSQKISSSQLWLMGGASWWRAGYGNTRPERAEFEQEIISYQGQFNYVKSLKKEVFLLFGVQYQRLESRFEWKGIENVELTLEDTVFQIRRNALTGEETEIRLDVTLTVPAERQVRHYNSFSLLQVPLGIGKSWGRGNLKSYLFAGGVANIALSKKGRTLYQTALIDYDKSTAGIWSDKVSFSAMLGGGLSYRLSNRLGVMTVAQYQHSLSNWSIEQGISMRPRILNWSLGLNYSF